MSVQLVDSQSEERVWNRDYDREIEDIFAIQTDIARKIADTLKVKIPQHERRAIEKKSTNVVEAYNLYLKGRYFWNMRTEDGLKKAIEYFENCLRKDPRYALAHTGLADSYTQLAWLEFLPPKEAFPRAKANAEEALDIDDRLSEAHTSLGLVMFQYEHEWSAARMEFERAIELNQNYAPAHQFYADLLKALGHFDEALTQMRQAQELDPLSLAVNTGIGHVLYLSRQYDRAIEQYAKTVRMDPNFLQARLWFGRPYLQKGMYKEAIEELKQAVTLSSASTMSLAVLGHAYASCGRKDEALKILYELFERSRTRYLPSYWIALVYIGLGDKDKAFEWLEKANEDKSSWLVWMKVEPRFDSLRSDPRFASLLERMGLAHDIAFTRSPKEEDRALVLNAIRPASHWRLSEMMQQQVSPQRERRGLAAIVFTDIVGYTSLAQSNEALALELLKEEEEILRKILPEYAGREVKTIGDSFLIEFASALDATQCAIEIQKVFGERNARAANKQKKLHLRIGIHVGDVVYRAGDIFGDAVNIASRIQPLAPPGGICMSQQVYDQVWNKIDRQVVELGKQFLKNVQSSLAVYQIGSDQFLESSRMPEQ